MAYLRVTLPDDVIEEFRHVYDNCEEIFGRMTKAGAEVVMQNIRANAPAGVRESRMMDCLKMTRTYKTPTDDGINTKVGFYGYFINENGKRTPAPLVANVFEYGNSTNNFPKQPFMRKSFRREQIEKVMMDEQRKASGGLLDE